MLRLTIISLALLVCAANASLFGSLLGSEKEVLVVAGEEKAKLDAGDSQPSEETALAVIDNDTPIAAVNDLGSEGQSNGVVVRAKRYYGCGCGCCGYGVTCATPDPAATVAPCGCGCCGCGYG